MCKGGVIFLSSGDIGWLFNALFMTKLHNFSRNFLFPILSPVAAFESLPSCEDLKPYAVFCLKGVKRDSCQIGIIADKIANYEVYLLSSSYLSGGDKSAKM